MNYIDLFSGIGGFALGAYVAGMRFEKHYFSEIEKYAVELYQKRFPDAIPLGDITKIDCSKLPKGEYIITGGFPCQDISIAGKGVGIEGKRSGLWFEYRRIISELQPRFAIMENVAALTFRGLGAVLGSLAEIGYDAEWQDIRAEDVGAPHRRERIWIVAYPSDIRRNVRRLERKGIQRENKARNEANTSSKTIPSTSKISYSNKNSKSVCSEYDKKIEIPDTPSSRLQRGECQKGFTSGCVGWFKQNNWTVEPNVDRLAHGISHRVDRIKGLGNAIVPQIAMILFERIKELCDV